jgi:subtilisin family serine protease
LVSAGIVVVAGVGNSTNDLAGTDGIYGTGDDYFPAALPETMAVSAMDPSTDTLWFKSGFSQIERTNGAPIFGSGDVETNYVYSSGGAIDVAAPGVNILTTSANGDYQIFTGTSAATPHVTGLVALYIAANGRATNAEGVWRIRQAIINASLQQSQWHPHGQPFDALTNNTADPDINHEPLAIASEDWIPKPSITSFTGTPGNIQAGFSAVPGYDYTVQSTTNLIPPIAWTNLTTISGSNFVTTVSVMDTNIANQNFYQLQRAPSP